MDVLIISLIKLVLVILNIFTFCIVAQAAMTWLFAFGVLNVHNRLTMRLAMMLDALVSPFLRPIRRIIPTFGGVDISPVILLLIIWFAKDLINSYAYRLLG